MFSLIYIPFKNHVWSLTLMIGSTAFNLRVFALDAVLQSDLRKVTGRK